MLTMTRSQATGLPVEAITQVLHVIRELLLAPESGTHTTKQVHTANKPHTTKQKPITLERIKALSNGMQRCADPKLRIEYNRLRLALMRTCIRAGQKPGDIGSILQLLWLECCQERAARNHTSFLKEHEALSYELQGVRLVKP